MSSRVDAFIIVAGGAFHALGLGLATGKPIIQLDPYKDSVVDHTSEAVKLLRSRLFKVSSAVYSAVKTVGVVVGTLPGQYRAEIAEYVADLATKAGLEPVFITSKYFKLENLVAVDNALNLDVYVVTSCPRLPIDDLAEFHKPVLTPGEFYMVYHQITHRELPLSYRYPW